MYEKISEIVFNYSIGNRYADDKFIRDIIDLVVSERNLNDYISKTTIILPGSFEKNYGSSHYSMKTMELCIDKSNKLKSFLPFNYNVLLFNMYVVVTILHELDHTKMKKQMTEGSKSLDVLLSSILYKESKNEDTWKDFYNLVREGLIYNHNHDSAPFERRANITSMLDASHVLKILESTSLSSNSMEKVRLSLLKRFIKKCRYRYKLGKDGMTNSPSYDYILKMHRQSELNEISIYDKDRNKALENAARLYNLKERVLLGLPLTEYEYDAIDKKINPFNAFVLDKSIKR